MEMKPSRLTTSTREIDIIVIVKALSLDAKVTLGEVFAAGAAGCEKPTQFALSGTAYSTPNGYSIL